MILSTRAGDQSGWSPSPFTCPYQRVNNLVTEKQLICLLIPSNSHKLLIVKNNHTPRVLVFVCDFASFFYLALTRNKIV
jgi:hypothetical protein